MPRRDQSVPPASPNYLKIITMRTLNTQELKTVAGAGLITGTLSTAVHAGAAIGNGLATAGKIVLVPVVKGTVTGAVKVFKFLI